MFSLCRALALVAAASLPSVAQAVAAGADEAKLRERIDQLERELQRATRELQDLRAKLGIAQPAPKTAELLQQLHGAYQSLKKEALDQEALFKAERDFEHGDAKSALRALRIGRHGAAVPLILKDMVLRESQPKFKREDLAGHWLALTLLTGENVEHPARSAHRLAEEWWQPRHKSLVTDIGKMTPEQVAQVARRLRDAVAPVEAYKSNGPAYEANALLYALAYNRGEDSPSGRRGGPAWYPEELHPALGAAFLAGMGYRRDGAGGQDVADVPYQLVDLLAAMRKNNMLPELHKIAEDREQNSAVRLVCLLSLFVAKEGVRVPAVLSILAREKKLERRITALAFLHYADDLEPAADYLLDVIDDPNLEVRRAALSAIGKHPPVRLLKRLTQMADAKHDGQVLETIAAMGTFNAQQFLAEYLAKTMNDRPKTDRIYEALWAFQHATGQSWVSAGRMPFDHHHRQATKALAWWKENGGK